MPKRKKHPRLPNGYGSIRYLGKSRKNPYAVHPPADIDGNRPPALCYVDDWMKGFIILTSYKAGTYTPGMEAALELPDNPGALDSLIEKIMADYNRVKGVEPDEPEKTFSEVYKAFYTDKFSEGNKYSNATKYSIKAAYKNCASLYDKIFSSLRAKDLQDNLDEMLLIMCYSGWRISEYIGLEVNLQKKYFMGGIKTEAGKGRIVPIHSGILPLVERRISKYGKLLPCSDKDFRKQMDELLNRLGIPGDPKHTPHDCRHTFSMLCEKYEVKENDRKRMMGHSFKADITNKVYGHRDIEDLRKELEKIIIDL